ncbi:MAG TPA: PAS domain-containing protein [Gemmatimonadaceae bacterium]|nr:PAS domain-containing protein [Gemmatimonadaceae bacterium]
MYRDQLDRLLQRTPDPAFALTSEGRIRGWNPAAERLTGIPAGEARGRSFAELLQPRDPLGQPVDREYCERAVRDGGVPSFDMQLRAPDGRELWINVSVLVFDAAGPSPAVIVHLAHDITASRERRAAYGHLEQVAREIVQMDDAEPHLVPVSPLSEQEQRILRAFAEGLGPADVARSLDISTQTLRNHLHHVNQKLGTHNRLEAVMHAQRRRFI